MAINDCILRFAGVVDLVGIVDLDEYVIPRFSSQANLGDIIKLSNKLLNANQCGEAYVFSSAFFDVECKNVTDHFDHPVGGSAFRSDWFPHGAREKTFVNPMSIYIQGIHYTQEFLQQPETRHRNDLDADDIPWIHEITGVQCTPVMVYVSSDIAAVHHYRYTDPNKRYIKDCHHLHYDPHGIRV